MRDKALRTLFRDLNVPYRQDETVAARALLDCLQGDEAGIDTAGDLAIHFIGGTRERFKREVGFGASLIRGLDLGQEDGARLMALAEALPRIPDFATKKELVRTHLSEINFKALLAENASLIEKLGQKLGSVLQKTLKAKDISHKPLIKQFFEYAADPGLRGATYVLRFVLGALADSFVMGETLESALKKANTPHECYSFDMLGEAALSEEDAKRYLENYTKAIHTLGASPKRKYASISVKLSALHPRYEFLKRGEVMDSLFERVHSLALLCAGYDIALTLDAEESERLTFSLELFERLLQNRQNTSWQGLGFAVQAYQKRALGVIAWLKEVALHYNLSIPLRLVKGAYWDTEIKATQEKGLEGYPVFTRKVTTDVSYLACAKEILKYPNAFKPQFATHNAHTIAALLSLPACPKDVEFQRLHGMGAELYDTVRAYAPKVACRVYAPIGPTESLLPYLVRRLIENGANSSFVHQLANDAVPAAHLAQNPLTQLRATDPLPHPAIPLPADLFAPDRENSKGVDLSTDDVCRTLENALNALPHLQAHSLVDGQARVNALTPLFNPADQGKVVGEFSEALSHDVDLALHAAKQAFPAWSRSCVKKRAAIFLAAADRLTKMQHQFIALLVLEAGKTVADASAEVREAVDFCRYYAKEGELLFEEPVLFKSITGERNTLTYEARGTFVCISPWNFPLAIFLGQVVAALMAGNTVIAKPAEQTPLIAYEATRLLLSAGVPAGALHLILGDGALGAQLVADATIAGVAFTGSFPVAQFINRTLAAKPTAIVPLIAETGGQNAMIVDSSALPEQVVRDIMASAFQSAGQRCSALRLLLIQEDVADPILSMLRGAMDQFRVGNPADFGTDLGPLIDRSAREEIERQSAHLLESCVYHHRGILSPELEAKGHYVAPAYFEIDRIETLGREIFGPVLQVYRYRLKDLARTIESLNRLGYGLTGGIHSRLAHRIQHVTETLSVGNVYVNRTIIGAIVGVQPFGGHGFSGTGPKAGGPHYLLRFVAEKSISTNTTAFGGNLSLLGL
jgi:RHH-type proline utilization regulon transcriptional repressor/proline dehydrogenase/delta 1-pyrroline-5-carboxylate dehydrogenase